MLQNLPCLTYLGPGSKYLVVELVFRGSIRTTNEEDQTLSQAEPKINVIAVEELDMEKIRIMKQEKINAQLLIKSAKNAIFLVILLVNVEAKLPRGQIKLML